MKNKVTFTTKTEEGVEIELCVKKPDYKTETEAQGVYSRVWRESAESKNYILRERLKKILREQNLWDDEKDKQYLEIITKIRAAELAIRSGGKKLSEIKDIALDLRGYRVDLQTLMFETSKYDNNTAEAQAENAKFDFLCSKCILDPTKEGSPYFASYEDYINRRSEQAAVDGASNLGSMLYGIDTDMQKKLPENEFLSKYGFVDEKYRLVNKEGKLVDREGKLIDENGRFVNENNEFVNANGDRVDEQGKVIVEFKPFLDDEGNPV